ncbi:MAG: response regulator [Phycisphaerae bacterium]|jgi:signal transduction histidine kinase|nr:response regulator [Phycisphaerae bacterium]
MAPKEKVNILLVDDQPTKLLSLETILADLDENVIKANSADEALRFLLAEECAVLLVDVCMPKMDGFELAELIRTHPRFGRTAIIFISAVYLTDADLLRGYDLGAVDYIPVPIVPEVLKAKVSVFAELFRKTSELRRLNGELERRLAELDRSNERLRFADRMATIGTLAAGLGHDMGNLLLPVRMRLDSLTGCDLASEARDDVAAIREATEYLQRLARSLRLLALDTDVEHSVEPSTNLGQWWRETEVLLRNAVGRNAELAVCIPEHLPEVRLDKAGLTQVVFNLIQNAHDALKGVADGKIVVSAVGSPDEQWVVLDVADNGPGMSEEACRRCLEPFFTTKTRELGTGLGLALVNGIIKRANGKVYVESRIGRGTTFSMELPAMRQATEAGGDAPTGAGVARVVLRTQRLRAHVVSILTGLDCAIAVDDSAEADLLVIEEDGNGALSAAGDFTERHPHRHAIVFSGEGQGESAEFEQNGQPSRVIRLDRSIRPSSLRVRIGETLASSCRGRGGHA